MRGGRYVYTDSLAKVFKLMSANGVRVHKRIEGRWVKRGESVVK